MEKLSLSSVKSFLSREEMRNVFGGDNRRLHKAGDKCFTTCNSHSDCSGDDQCNRCISAISGNQKECGS